MSVVHEPQLRDVLLIGMSGPSDVPAMPPVAYACTARTSDSAGYSLWITRSQRKRVVLAQWTA
jgi:hypothetical protein